MKTRTILVDDEPPARSRMRDLLAEHSDVGIIADCSTAQQARAAIDEHSPDLIFLDMQMPGMTGLKFMQSLGEADLPLVVFVTAHESFAVEAFDTRAVDYVLKPVRPERLGRALTRVREQLAVIREPAPAGTGPLPEQKPAGAKRIARLMARTNGRIVFIKHEQIDWIESAGNYVIVHAGDERHIIRETMAVLEEGLPSTDFVRLNRSLIAHVDRILELKPNGQGSFYALMRGGKKVNVTVGLRELEQRLRFGE